MEQQIAKLNYLKMAPRKVRAVGDLIKGLSINEAEAQLLIQPRRASVALLKLLRSAVANAKNNKKIDVNTLFILNVRVDKGPMLKRSLPRARGSASPIHKVMSNVIIILGVKESVKPRFNIVTPKKIKQVGGRKIQKKEKPAKESTKEKVVKIGKENPEMTKSGFLKKVFNPNARSNRGEKV